jgi:NAD(P)-dependent dehydrogenase (short-subunit alcohol dehydrogenase family)
VDPPAEIRFDQEDVAAFARASGDVNPLHVDPQAARRSPFGGCVVHGCLLGIGMLGSLPDAVLASVRSLDLSFSSPLLVGATARLETRSVDGRWSVELTGRGKRLARLRISADVDPHLHAIETSAMPGARTMRTVPAVPDLGESAWRSNIAISYHDTPELDELADRLGAVALEPRLLRALAWSSYVVGMEIPGLHSLLGGVSLGLVGHAAGERGAGLRVRDVDERTGRVAIDSTLDGVALAIESFARDAAHALDVDRLRPAEPRQPVGEAVAVVGASRGLGAALALAFLQRGYEVHGIYSMSTDAAHEVQELAGDAANRLLLHRADATSAARLDEIAADLRARGVPLRGLVLAAAAPPLGMSLDAESAGELARYVGASVQLAAAPLGAVLPLLDRGWVVFCSSSAMSAPPRDWPHYIAAKGALEGLATWLAAAAPGVASVVVRPPKLLTEMTNTPAGRIGAAPVEPFAGRLADVVEGLPPGLTLLGPNAEPFEPGERP